MGRNYKNAAIPLELKSVCSKNNQALYGSPLFLNYYNRLKNLAVSMFEWKNLPDTVDERFLELTLFEKGWAVFFRNSDNDSLMALECLLDGELNSYRIPVRRRAYAINGFQQTLYPNDSVLIFNNYVHTPTCFDIMEYALKLYQCDSSININMNAQKYPKLITCPENQRLSLKNMLEQYDGNSPIIFGDKKLDLSSISVLDLNAPYNIDKLDIHKCMIWNEILTFLGINNANQNKKERLVADEVSANNEHVFAEREIMLASRLQAAKEINQLFGTNIEVSYRVSRYEPDITLEEGFEIE